MKTHQHWLFISAATFLLLIADTGATSNSAQELTLEQALDRAMLSNPSLEAAEHAVSAAEALVKQSNRLPNPEIEIEVENFAGSDEMRSFDAAEQSFVITQPILLGGKRSHRREIAVSQRRLADLDHEALRLDVVAQTTEAFYSALVAQQREALTGELVSLADTFQQTVQARVDAGKVSPVEAIRAKIQVAETRIEASRAKRLNQAARAHLTAQWGRSQPNFLRAVGNLPEPEPPPPIEVLIAELQTTPEILRTADEIRIQQQTFELERASAIPDLAISVGPRRFSDSGQSAWVAGLSMPIPLFDRRQDAKRAAEFELHRRQRLTESERIRRIEQLTTTTLALRSIAEAAETLDQEIVPAATAALTAMELGYREGKFGFLDLLDAQRSFFDARSLHLDVLAEYASGRAQLERLIGQPLSSLSVASHQGGQS